MGESLGEIFVDVVADTSGLADSFADGLGDVEAQAGGVGQRLESALTGPVAKGMAAVGAGAAAALGTGLTAAAGLDNQLREVVTLFGETGAEAQASLERLSGPLRDLSDQVGIAQSELTDGLYNAISAGVPEENVFEFLETASQFAIGGVTDVETAVDGLSTAINAFGLDAADADQVADAFFAAVQAGKTNAEELSSALFNVAPAASAAGISLEETLAATAGLTASGVPTKVATTQIRAAINELADEGTNVAGVFEGLTGKTFREFTAGGGTLEEALGELSSAAEDAGMQVGDYFGSVEASAAATTLGVDASGAFADALEYQADAAGAAAGAYELVAESAATQFAKLKTQGMNILIELGAVFLPVVNTILGAVIGLFDTLRGIPDGAMEIIAWVGGFVAVLGPLPFLIGKSLPALTTLAGVILGPVGAIAALAGAAVVLYRDFEPFAGFVDGIVDRLQMAWTIFQSGDGIIDSVTRSLMSLTVNVADGALAAGIRNVGDTAEYVVDRFRAAWNVFRDGDGLIDSLTGAFVSLTIGIGDGALPRFIRDVGEQLGDLWGLFRDADGIVDGFRAVWDNLTGPGDGTIGLLDVLRDGFDQFRDWLTSDGADLFAGLLEGAQAGFTAVVDWLTDGGFALLVGGFVDGRLRLLDAAMQLFPVILDAVVAFLPGLVDFLAGTVVPAIVDVVVGAVPIVLTAAIELFGSLITAVTDILPGIVDVLFGTVLPTLVGTVVDMLPGLLDAALLLFGALVDAVVDIVPTLVSTLLGDVLPSLVDTVLRMLPGLLSAATDLFGALVDAAVTIIPPLATTLLTDVLPALIRAVLDMVPGLLTAAVELFGTLVQGVLDILPDLITILLTEVLPALVTTIVGLVPDLLVAAVQAFGALVSAIWDVLPTLLSTIIFEVGPALVGAVLELIPALFTAGLELMGGLIGAIGEKLGEARDAVGEVVGAMRDRVSERLTEMRDTAAERVGGLRDAVVERTTEMRDRVGDRLSEMRDTAAERLTSMRDTLVETAGNLRDDVVKRAGAMRDRVVSAVDGMREGSHGAAGEWIAGMIDRAVELRDTVVARVGELRDRVVGWIDDLRENTLGTIRQWVVDAVIFVMDLRTRFTNSVQRMVDAVGERIEDLLTWFRELPGRILTAIGDLGSLLVQAGKDLVGGLVSGVGDMASSAADAVGGVARGMVSRATGIFRNESPSKVFRDIGHDVVAGLTLGIRSDGAAAVDAVGDVASRIVAAASGIALPAVDLGLDNLTDATPDALRQLEALANGATGVVGSARFVEGADGILDRRAATVSPRDIIAGRPEGRGETTIIVNQQIAAPSPRRAGDAAARRLTDAVYLAGGTVDGTTVGAEGRPW